MRIDIKLEEILNEIKSFQISKQNSFNDLRKFFELIEKYLEIIEKRRRAYKIFEKHLRTYRPQTFQKLMILKENVYLLKNGREKLTKRWNELIKKVEIAIKKLKSNNRLTKKENDLIKELWNRLEVSSSNLNNKEQKLKEQKLKEQKLKKQKLNLLKKLINLLKKLYLLKNIQIHSDDKKKYNPLFLFLLGFTQEGNRLLFLEDKLRKFENNPRDYNFEHFEYGLEESFSEYKSWMEEIQLSVKNIFLNFLTIRFHSERVKKLKKEVDKMKGIYLKEFLREVCNFGFATEEDIKEKFKNLIKENRDIDVIIKNTVKEASRKIKPYGLRIRTHFDKTYELKTFILEEI